MRRRFDSAEDMSRYGAEQGQNPMTVWLHSYGFWALYISMITVTRLVLWMIVNDPAEGWTLTCVAHAAISHVLLHQLKGAPIGDITIMGKYDHLTFWEQIDNEYHGTFIRKAFMTVPIIILAISFNWVRNDWTLLPWVLLSTLCCIVPKLAFMHRKRLLPSDESPPLSPR